MAGNFIKNELYDDLVKSSAQTALNTFKPSQNQNVFEHLDQHILETLLKENRQLKQEFAGHINELEELREKVDTLTYLEQEASEENEVMRFKVLSLEAQAQIDGVDTSELKIIDELRISKKELQSELDLYRTQVQGYKVLLNQYAHSEEIIPSGVESQSENEQMLSSSSLNITDPKIIIGQLKMLYDLNKVELSEQDQIQIACSLYLKEKEVVRFYREKLFENIAKKAIEQAEYLYKNRGNRSSVDNQGSNQIVDDRQQSKIFIENKRLKKQVEALQQQINELNEQDSQQKQSIKQLRQHKQSFESKISLLNGQIQDLQLNYLNLRQEALENQELTKDYIEPNIKIINDRVQNYQALVKQRIQDAHKAVYDKNRQINDYFNQNNSLQQQVQELQKQAQDSQTNAKGIYEKNRQIGDLFNENNQLKTEANSAKEKQIKIEDELRKLKQKLQLSQQDYQSQISELTIQNQQQETELNRLYKELKNAQNQRKLSSQPPAQIQQTEAGPQNLQEIQELRLKNQELQQKLSEKEQELVKVTYDKMLREKLGIQQEQVSKEVEEARKAVFEKNKLINEYYNKIRELEEKLNSQDKGKDVKQEYDRMLRERLGIKDEQISKEVEEARKAVFEKNKMINEQYNKIRELEEKLSQTEQNKSVKQEYDKILRERLGIKDEVVSKEVEDARKAVYEKNKIINQMANEQMELKKKIEELEDKAGIRPVNSQVSQSYQEPPRQQTQDSGDFFGGFFTSIQKQIFGGEQQQTLQQNQKPSQSQYSFGSIQANSFSQKQEPKPQQNEEIFDPLSFLSFKEEEKSQQKVIEPIAQTSKSEQVFKVENKKKPNATQSSINFLSQQPQTSNDFDDDFLSDFTSFSQPKDQLKQQQPDISDFKENSKTISNQKNLNESKSNNMLSFSKVEKSEEKKENQSILNMKEQSKPQVQQKLDLDFLNFGEIKPKPIETKKEKQEQTKQNSIKIEQPNPIFDILNFEQPQQQKPPAGLDFLEDMFSGLLGNTVSKQLNEQNQKQEEEKSKQLSQQQLKVESLGWADEDDIILNTEEEKAPLDLNITGKASNLTQPLHQQKDLINQKLLNDDKIEQNKVITNDSNEQQNLPDLDVQGWGDEEIIIKEHIPEYINFEQLQSNKVVTPLPESQQQNQQNERLISNNQYNAQEQVQAKNLGWGEDDDILFQEVQVSDDHIHKQEQFTQEQTQNEAINLINNIDQKEYQELAYFENIEEKKEEQKSIVEENNSQQQQQQVSDPIQQEDNGWGDDELEIDENLNPRQDEDLSNQEGQACLSEQRTFELPNNQLDGEINLQQQDNQTTLQNQEGDEGESQNNETNLIKSHNSNNQQDLDNDNLIILPVTEDRVMESNIQEEAHVELNMNSELQTNHNSGEQGWADDDIIIAEDDVPIQLQTQEAVKIDQVPNAISEQIYQQIEEVKDHYQHEHQETSHSQDEIIQDQCQEGGSAGIQTYQQQDENMVQLEEKISTSNQQELNEAIMPQIQSAWDDEEIQIDTTTHPNYNQLEEEQKFTNDQAYYTNSNQIWNQQEQDYQNDDNYYGAEEDYQEEESDMQQLVTEEERQKLMQMMDSKINEQFMNFISPDHQDEEQESEEIDQEQEVEQMISKNQEEQAVNQQQQSDDSQLHQALNHQNNHQQQLKQSQIDISNQDYNSEQITKNQIEEQKQETQAFKAVPLNNVQINFDDNWGDEGDDLGLDFVADEVQADQNFEVAPLAENNQQLHSNLEEEDEKEAFQSQSKAVVDIDLDNMGWGNDDLDLGEGSQQKNITDFDFQGGGQMKKEHTDPKIDKNQPINILDLLMTNTQKTQQVLMPTDLFSFDFTGSSNQQQDVIKLEQKQEILATKERGWSADMDDILVDQNNDDEQQIDSMGGDQQIAIDPKASALSEIKTESKAAEQSGWDDDDIIDI